MKLKGLGHMEKYQLIHDLHTDPFTMQGICDKVFVYFESLSNLKKKITDTTYTLPVL